MLSLWARPMPSAESRRAPPNRVRRVGKVAATATALLSFSFISAAVARRRC